MFSADFYPTPQAVIERMVNGTNLQGRFVLEPEAGAGHILEYVAGLGATTVACELNVELAFIAKGKAHQWLKNDFLQVTREEVSHIQHIIMNPPFSADVKHILHAWEVAPDGCEITALSNYESISNLDRNRNRSRLKNLINTYGIVENLGECFTTAERKTNVQVALIRLYKPESDSNFEGYFDMGDDEPQKQAEGLMSYDAILDVVNRYVEALKLYDKVADNAIRMNSLIGAFQSSDITFTLKSENKEQSIEAFKKGLQKKAWKWVFGKLDMNRFVTNKLMEDLNKFVEQQTKVPFTRRNVYKMLDMIAQTHGQRMDQALVDVFDKLTEHYHENRYNVEGWKTNSHYLVGKKFIFPWIVEMDWGVLNIRYSSHNAKTFEDLIKALDYLTGERQCDTLIDPNCKYGFTYPDLSNYIRGLKMKTNTWYPCAYFMIKGFKKGTLHCKWRNHKTWELFSRAVAAQKGWELPESI